VLSLTEESAFFLSTLQEVAEIVLFHILHHFNNFPPPDGAAHINR
jgi:hypothetical protein